MLAIFEEYRKKRSNNHKRIDVTQESKILQLVIDNGGRIVIDLEVFAT